ncbi:hypothetical protein V1505DRAFT_368025 [Lipomyces doorenjongii]
MSTNDKPIRNLPEQISEGDNEPDEWDKRIEDTGCASENMSLTNCYADNGRDWRKCAKEVSKSLVLVFSTARFDMWI